MKTNRVKWVKLGNYPVLKIIFLYYIDLFFGELLGNENGEERQPHLNNKGKATLISCMQLSIEELKKLKQMLMGLLMIGPGEGSV